MMRCVCEMDLTSYNWSRRQKKNRHRDRKSAKEHKTKKEAKKSDDNRVRIKEKTDGLF